MKRWVSWLWSWLRSFFSGWQGITSESSSTPEGITTTIPPAPPVTKVEAEAVPTRSELQALAEKVATRHAIPPALFKALVSHESGWNPRAIRLEPAINDASRGLTQILYRTARGLGYTGTPEGLFDPAVNLEHGARYLTQQYQRFGSWPAALAAYNGGPRAGRPVTKDTVTVLARDQVTGQPIKRFTARPGQFRNQPYVDAVLRAASRFGFTAALAGGGVLGWLMVLVLVGTLVFKRGLLR